MCMTGCYCITVGNKVIVGMHWCISTRLTSDGINATITRNPFQMLLYCKESIFPFLFTYCRISLVI